MTDGKNRRSSILAKSLKGFANVIRRVALRENVPVLSASLWLGGSRPFIPSPLEEVGAVHSWTTCKGTLKEPLRYADHPDLS